MANAYFLACNVEDFNEATGECAHPYYGTPPQFFPVLSFADGVLIAGAIGGTWTLGLVARLLIRAGQQETHRS